MNTNIVLLQLIQLEQAPVKHHDVLEPSLLCRCDGDGCSDGDGQENAALLRQQEEIHQVGARLPQPNHHHPARGTHETLFDPRQGSRMFRERRMRFRARLWHTGPGEM